MKATWKIAGFTSGGELGGEYAGRCLFCLLDFFTGLLVFLGRCVGAFNKSFKDWLPIEDATTEVDSSVLIGSSFGIFSNLSATTKC